MRNQRGFINAIVLLFIVVIAIGAVNYFVFVKNASAPVVENNISASIDHTSLTSSSPNPTITGAATNISKLAVFIYNTDFDHQPDYGVYGPYPGVIDVVNGRWSYHLGTNDYSGATNLEPGTYKVEVRNYFGSKSSDGEGLARLLQGQILATGLLTVSSGVTQ